MNIHLCNTTDIMPFMCNGRQTCDKVMMWDSQIIKQFSGCQIPYQQRKWLLSFITTDQHSAINSINMQHQPQTHKTFIKYNNVLLVYNFL